MKKGAHPTINFAIDIIQISKICSTYSCFFYTAQAIKGNPTFGL